MKFIGCCIFILFFLSLISLFVCERKTGLIFFRYNWFVDLGFLVSFVLNLIYVKQFLVEFDYSAVD